MKHIVFATKEIKSSARMRLAARGIQIGNGELIAPAGMSSEEVKSIANGVDEEIPNDIANAIIEGCRDPLDPTRRSGETDMQWAFRTHGGARLKVRN